MMRGWVRFTVASATSMAALLLLAGQAEAATTSASWSMESPTRMLDGSGNANHGTTTAITGVPGSPGKGYRFNGSNSVVTVPNAPSLNPGTATLTITAKVRFTVIPTPAVVDYDLVRKGVSATPGGEFKMEIYPTSSYTTGPAYCLFKDSAGKVAFIRDTRNLADGKWHTISCVKTSTAIKVIVDGVTRSKPASLGAISNTSPLTVGAKPGGGDQYRGDMDEVGIKLG
jgi:hypothetical protein